MNKLLSHAALALFAVSSLGYSQDCAVAVDFNDDGEAYSSMPPLALYETNSFTNFNGKYYFAAETFQDGVELYATDGTVLGTQMLADINALGDSDPVGFREVGGKLYFVAEDEIFGRRLRVIDPATPSVYSTPLSDSFQPVNAADSFAPIGNKVVFIGSTDSAEPSLWISEGTDATTHQIVGAGSGPIITKLSQLTTLPSGTRVIGSGMVQGMGEEVIITDGTAAGTGVLDIYPGATGSRPFNFTNWNGLTYFNADGPGTGRELWVTDGRMSGTHLVKDITPGQGDSDPILFNSTTFGGELYFPAGPWPNATLWKTDGTTLGTMPAVDPSSPVVPKDVTHLAVLAGDLMLIAEGDPGTGHKLFKVNLAGQASFVAEFALSSSAGLNGYESAFAAVGNVLCFSAAGLGGIQLWMTDGTAAGTTMLTNTTLSKTSFSQDLRLTPTGPSSLLFAFEELAHGRELWTSDLTPAGTHLLVDLEPKSQTLSSLPKSMMSPNGIDLLGFAYRDGVYGLWKADSDNTIIKLAELEYPYASQEMFIAPVFLGGQQKALFHNKRLSANPQSELTELWITDFTPGGTHLLKEPGVGYYYSSDPSDFLQLGDSVLFTAWAATGKRELFITDGTSQGTGVLKVLYPTSSSTPSAEQVSYIGGLTEINGRVLFRATDGPTVNGAELWSTDGTPGGTTMVMDINPGVNSSYPWAFVHYNDLVYFTAYTDAEQVQIWSTDGTAAGTSMLLDLDAIQSFTPEDLFTFNGLLYFTAGDLTAQGGKALFHTNGTALGTVRAGMDGIGTSILDEGVVSGGIMYFSYGSYPWRSDGTQVGTYILVDPSPESGHSPKDFIAANSGVFYLAWLDDVGHQLWFSDGTKAGTHQVCKQDLIWHLSNPFLANGKLYFTGYRPDVSMELFNLQVAGPYSLDIGPGGSAPVLASNAPQLGTQLTVTCDKIPPGSASLLVVSNPVASPSSFLTAGEPTSWIDPATAQLMAIELGTNWTWTTLLPGSPSLVGVQLNAQAFILPGASFPAQTSNGLSLVLGS